MIATDGSPTIATHPRETLTDTAFAITGDDAQYTQYEAQYITQCMFVVNKKLDTEALKAVIDGPNLYVEMGVKTARKLRRHLNNQIGKF